MNITMQVNSSKNTAWIGTVSGIIAGIVMLGPMMSMMTMMNLPQDLFPTLIGMMIGQKENPSMLGIGFHFISSAIIGTVFGFVVLLPKLKISGFAKGIGLGIVTGIISYVVLFLPMMMFVLPPTMMDLMKMMNPGSDTQMIMQQIQSMQPMILVGSLVAHLVYGIVLGAVYSGIIKRGK